MEEEEELVKIPASPEVQCNGDPCFDLREMPTGGTGKVVWSRIIWVFMSSEESLLPQAWLGTGTMGSVWGKNWNLRGSEEP